MFGAIIGDIIGSKFEFDRGPKSKEFKLFSHRDKFTDDTVMTIAVADALLKAGTWGEKEFKDTLIRSMKKWGRRYPYAGYGGRFIHWVLTEEKRPYKSYGNGSAMRVSPVGWYFDNLEKTREVARWTAEVTHNHPEGIKGAESVAAAIFLARTGAGKKEIRKYIEKEFGYKLDRTLDEIAPNYHHVEDCMHSVPEAITCFLEGEGYEDTIRNVMYIGGDTDTLGAIAGAIAEAAFGIPVDILQKGITYMEEDILNVMQEFYQKAFGCQSETNEEDYEHTFLQDRITNALATKDFHAFFEVLCELMALMREEKEAYTQMRDVSGNLGMIANPESIVGAKVTMDEEVRLRFQYVMNDEKENWIALYTGREERDKINVPTITMNVSIEAILREGLRCDLVAGVVINPFGAPFALHKTHLKLLFDLYDKETNEQSVQQKTRG